MVPPPYPRIPYLWSTESATADDRLVPPGDRDAWFRREVDVEEKLDGANVCIWWDAGVPSVASRGGPDAMDRAGQLGPLRARVFADVEGFRGLLEGGRVLYAEWLWFAHSVYYERLPDPLVALDVLNPGSGFSPRAERDQLCGRAGLTIPPLLFRGVLGSGRALLDLLGTSAFGTTRMEGAVLRREDGERCKVVAPGFVRASDKEIARTRNGVVVPP